MSDRSPEAEAAIRRVWRLGDKDRWLLLVYLTERNTSLVTQALDDLGPHFPASANGSKGEGK